MPTRSGPAAAAALPATRKKLIASLHSGKYRRRHGLAILEGTRSILAALEARAPLEEIVCTAHGRTALAEARIPAHLPVYVVDDRTLGRLADVSSHQGVLATVRIESRSFSSVPDGARRIVLLDGIQDPGNVGTVIRSAAWYNVDCVIAGEGTADFFNPKTLRSGMGGHWSVSLFQHEDLGVVVDLLREANFRVAVARADGDSRVGPNRVGENSGQRLALVLGSEAHGVTPAVEQRADVALAIISPQRNGHPGVDSLNVAVAAGILMDRLFGEP